MNQIREEIVAELGPTEEYSHVCYACEKKILQVGDKIIITNLENIGNNVPAIKCQHINNE